MIMICLVQSGWTGDDRVFDRCSGTACCRLSKMLVKCATLAPVIGAEDVIRNA